MMQSTSHKTGFPGTLRFAVLIVPLLAGVLNTHRARAQAQPAPPNSKSRRSGPTSRRTLGGTWRIAPGGRFTGENIPLKFLLTTAYQLKESQFSGIPGWADAEKYDITAKGEGSPSQDHRIR